MKTFTEDEKIIARNIDKEYQWMARDSDRKKKRAIGTLLVMTTFPLSAICSLLSNGKMKSLR